MATRRAPLTRWAAGTAALAVLLTSVADGSGFLPTWRIRRMDDAATMVSPPFVPEEDGPECDLFPGVPEILGATFDPDRYDEIDVAGNGRHVAYASAVTPTSPGQKAIVVLSEGGTSELVAEAAGDDDQPSIDLDPFGWRMVFRGSDGVAGESGSNVYLATYSRFGDADAEEPGPTLETVNLTNLDTSTGLFARDPRVSGRARTRDVGSGVKVRERDARVVFVSNGDLDFGRRRGSDEETGRNPTNVEQVFLWRERGDRFVQLTRNTDPNARVARPSLSGNGRRIVFESDADLTPDQANPRDPTEVGNPDGVRQIYLWTGRRGRNAIRQLTWSDEDCFSPRISGNGRFVFFCSRGDLLPGGNPEGNFEIFRWRQTAKRTRRIRQLTQTRSGHSVLPRPLRSPRRLVFWSTASPPANGLPFGAAGSQCGPTALLWSGRDVQLVYGLLDTENAELILQGLDPVIVGPPTAATPSKVHFATNDPLLDPPDAAGQASLIRYHLGRATLFRRPGP